MVSRKLNRDILWFVIELRAGGRAKISEFGGMYIGIYSGVSICMPSVCLMITDLKESIRHFLFDGLGGSGYESDYLVSIQK